MPPPKYPPLGRRTFPSEPGTNPESPFAKDRDSWRWQIDNRVSALEYNMNAIEESFKEMGDKLNFLVTTEARRSEREQIMERINSQQSAFTRWVIPLMVTLIVTIVGATVWIVTKVIH